MTDLIQQGT